MEKRAQVIIEKGPEAGREIDIPADGARFGRSSKNDVVVNDESVSRHHCRFYFKSDGSLAIADLGSANQTQLNDETVHESPLSIGDRVAIGDTVLKVVDDGSAGSGIDLGLKSYDSPPPRSKMSKSMLLTLLVVVILIAFAAWLPRLLRPDAAKTSPKIPKEIVEKLSIFPLEIRYEKVLGDDSRIFRYLFQIHSKNKIAIDIDDTELTHIREEGAVSDDLIEELAEFVRDSGFFKLSDEYTGRQRNVLDHWDITVTLGKESKRVRVINRTEPDAFKKLRTKLENFGQVELGLWAIQFPPEELMGRAERAFLQGKKLYAERTVEYGNLARSITSFKEADFYLRTIDPKPDYYSQILNGITTSREALDEEYVDRNYGAERAIRIKDWEEAAAQLRILCRMFPDRTDDRYGEARNKLIEVERRIQIEKK